MGSTQRQLELGHREKAQQKTCVAPGENSSRLKTSPWPAQNNPVGPTESGDQKVVGKLHCQAVLVSVEDERGFAAIIAKDV